MKFLSLEPFVPSGKDLDASKHFFTALGFSIKWDTGDYVGFEKDGCSFILQKNDNEAFAQNFMLTVKIENAEAFRKNVIENQLPEKFGIRVGELTRQPYGKEVNIIDIAGVCWHFVE
jgi:catechol 2,3-dioxygenase-like lactoylglutathione lyase family enzyme